MAFLQVYFNGELKFTAPLQPAATSIGRAADNDIVIDNGGVSGHHAVIEREGESFYITDNNSTNGVFVNGHRVSREQLRYGDEITVFKHKLKFIAVDLSQDAADAAKSNPSAVNPNETVQIDAAQLQAILQQQRALVPYLLQTGSGRQDQKWPLSKPRFEFGKNKTCDIQVGGWFAPKLSAVINRQSDGYYLVPERWGKVRLNGAPLSERIKLQNLDKLQVRDMALTFYQPAVTLPASA